MNESNDSHIYNKNTEGAFSKCFHGTVGVGCGCVFFLIVLPILLFGGCSLLANLLDGSSKKTSLPSYEDIQRTNFDNITPELRGYSIGIGSQVVNQFQQIPRFYQIEVFSKLKEIYPDLELTLRYKKDKPSIEEISPLNSIYDSKRYGWIWEFTTNESVDENDIKNNRSTDFVAIYDRKGILVVVESESKIFFTRPEKKVLDALKNADFVSSWSGSIRDNY